MSRTVLTHVLAASVIAVTLGSTASSAGAEGWRYNVDKRQVKQTQAIKAGRKDGGLTFWEAYGLRREQKRIARLERDYKSDGYLQKSEKRVLRNAQDNAADHIVSARENGRVRGWWWRTFVR